MERLVVLVRLAVRDSVDLSDNREIAVQLVREERQERQDLRAMQDNQVHCCFQLFSCRIGSVHDFVSPVCYVKAVLLTNSLCMVSILPLLI